MKVAAGRKARAAHETSKLKTELNGPKFATLGFGKFMSGIEEAKKAIINLIFISLFIFLIVTVYKAVRADEAIIEPIGIPKLMKDIGYTEDIISTRLAQAIKNINKEAKTQRNPGDFRPSSQGIDISLPGAGISFKSFVQVVREIVGRPQIRVTGEFICLHDPCTLDNLPLQIRVYKNSREPEPADYVSESTIERELEVSAEQVVRRVSPAVFASYLTKANGGARRAEAIKVAEEVLKIIDHPDYAWALNFIGMSHYNQRASNNDELDKAIGLFNQAIAVDSRLSGAYFNLGLALEKKNDRDTAIANYRKGLAIEPNDAAAHNNLGVLLTEKQDYASALAEFKKAVELNPNYPGANFNLGNALRLNNDNKAALETFEKYLSRWPNEREAVNAQVFVQDLKANLPLQ